MKIDSSLNGFYQHRNRPVEVETTQEEAPQREASTFTPSAGALTGSSTFLSSSLAKALWAMEFDEAGLPSDPAAANRQDWVKDTYQEFN